MFDKPTIYLTYNSHNLLQDYEIDGIILTHRIFLYIKLK